MKRGRGVSQPDDVFTAEGSFEDGEGCGVGGFPAVRSATVSEDVGGEAPLE